MMPIRFGRPQRRLRKMENNCIFCRIAKGEIPCYKVYEDRDFLAFLDIRPLNKGHTLVIPKQHYRWVWDVKNIGDYYKAVQKVANAQKKAFGTDYVISLVAGEEVQHAHVWLVPRFKGDGHGGAIRLDNIKSLSKEDMEEAARLIKAQLQQ